MKRSRGQRMLQASQTAPSRGSSSRNGRNSIQGVAVVDKLDASSSQKDADKQTMEKLSENATRLSKSREGIDNGKKRSASSFASTSSSISTSNDNHRTSEDDNNSGKAERKKKKIKKTKTKHANNPDNIYPSIDLEQTAKDSALFKIENNFRWIELAVAKLSKRIATWSKIQTYVEQVSKTTFTMEDLGRILYIWPEGYEAQWKKVSVDLMGQQDIHLCLDIAKPAPSPLAHASTNNDEARSTLVSITKDSQVEKITITPTPRKDTLGLLNRMDTFRKLLYEKVKIQGVDEVLREHGEMLPRREKDPGVFQLGAAVESVNGDNNTTTTNINHKGNKDKQEDNKSSQETVQITMNESLPMAVTEPNTITSSQSLQLASIRDNTFTGRLDMSTKDTQKIISKARILDMSQLRSIALKREAEAHEKEVRIIAEKKRNDALSRIRSIPVLCDSLRSYLKSKGSAQRNGNKLSVFTQHNSRSSQDGGHTAKGDSMRALPLAEAIIALRPSATITDVEMRARFVLMARNIPTYVKIVPADMVVKEEVMQVNLGYDHQSVRDQVGKFVEQSVLKIIEKYGHGDKIQA